MDRRDVLRALGGAFSLAWARTVQGRLQTLSGEGRFIFRTLDPGQGATVAEIAEIILPATDTPGAKDAKVVEFADLMLTEWFTAEERARFLAGLARLDEMSQSSWGRPFIELTEPRRREALRMQELEAIATRPRAELAEGAAASASSPADRHFFDVAKWLTLVGYFTSEVGLRDELQHETFPVSYTGCAPFDRG